MDRFAPEFSQYWLASLGADAHDGSVSDEDSRTEAAALEELAERVNAARCVF